MVNRWYICCGDTFQVVEVAEDRNFEHVALIAVVRALDEVHVSRLGSHTFGSRVSFDYTEDPESLYIDTGVLRERLGRLALTYLDTRSNTSIDPLVRRYSHGSARRALVPPDDRGTKP